MIGFARRTFVSVFAAGALMTGAAIPAMAAPPTQQDGLINVTVGGCQRPQ
jgi:hypothetical protein